MDCKSVKMQWLRGSCSTVVNIQHTVSVKPVEYSSLLSSKSYSLLDNTKQTKTQKPTNKNQKFQINQRNQIR